MAEGESSIVDIMLLLVFRLLVIFLEIFWSLEVTLSPLATMLFTLVELRWYGLLLGLTNDPVALLPGVVLKEATPLEELPWPKLVLAFATSGDEDDG